MADLTHTPGSIDLHTHSTASDGRLSPTALVDRAADGGVRLLALTDHDTLAGLDEASHQARIRGIELIKGVEMSVTWEKRTLHIVGLGVATSERTLASGLAGLQALRDQRARAMGKQLEAEGLAGASERARELAGGGQITRAHYARLLVDDGLCDKPQQAFKRYLKPGRPGYVNVTWAGLEEAIGWIHAAGGQAVLAHPMAYGMTGAWRRRMLTAFCDAGGDAMEVCCGNHNPSDNHVCARDARHYGLKGSVGSDYHGPHQRWLALGRPLPLPADIEPVWVHLSF